MLINIRGSQGAGKTTAAKILYKEFTLHTRFCNINTRGNRKALTHCSGSPLFNHTAFVGEYTNNDPYTTDAFSGADQLSYVSELLTLAEFCTAHRLDMLWEASFMQSYSTIQKLAELDSVLVLWLNTDPEQIYRQRLARSEVNGGGKTITRQASLMNADAVRREAHRIAQLDNVTLVETTHSSIVEDLHKHTVKHDYIPYTPEQVWDLSSKLMLDTSKRNQTRKLPHFLEEQ